MDLRERYVCFVKQKFTVECLVKTYLLLLLTDKLLGIVVARGRNIQVMADTVKRIVFSTLYFITPIVALIDFSVACIVSKNLSHYVYFSLLSLNCNRNINRNRLWNFISHIFCCNPATIRYTSRIHNASHSFLIVIRRTWITIAIYFKMFLQVSVINNFIVTKEYLLTM